MIREKDKRSTQSLKSFAYMPQQYNQLRAMMAVTKASLKATFRSPQSLFFSLFFPIVLIWIFGSLGRGGGASVDVAFEKNVDTANVVYQSLLHNPVLHIEDNVKKNIEDDLKKGRITAIIGIKPISANISNSTPGGQYDIHLRTSSASQKDMPVLESILKNVVNGIDEKLFPGKQSVATFSQTVEKGRIYRMIDFFLPGMIGFSLIGSAVFSIAFLFYSLRETLVLKRMYSTPIKKQYIILGEGISKVLFQLMTVVVLIGFGYFAYNFTLANGLYTFFDMLILSFLALLVFMGFGFFITAIAKNQNVIPIYANLFMFPQYFLSGTFFSKNALPASIQPVIKFLPLTAVNDAMRNVAFEGASLWSCWQQMLILVVWGIIIYTLTARVFRWE
jgi:ABC-2 type transport system permease protein